MSYALHPIDSADEDNGHEAPEVIPSGAPLFIKPIHGHEWTNTPDGRTDVNAPTVYRCWWSRCDWHDFDALPMDWSPILSASKFTTADEVFGADPANAFGKFLKRVTETAVSPNTEAAA